MIRNPLKLFGSLAAVVCLSVSVHADDLYVRGEKIYTMDKSVIENGVIFVRDGKIKGIGDASEIRIPDEAEVVEAAVVTPGLIDAHSVVGLAGIWNQDQDQDQLETSTPMQPQLRAIDAYNPYDPLIEWIRGFGVTTVHTGHAPGVLISGQTMVVKTVGNHVEAAALIPEWGVMCTLGESAIGSSGASPGTRGKMVAMLRQKFIDAQQYLAKQQAAEDADDGSTARDLELETLGKCLNGRLAFIVHANRVVDIRNAIRLAEEFQLKLVLDGAAEAYLVIDELLERDIPVFVHPTMARPSGDLENMTFQNAAALADAGVLTALQSGYEAYVPKSRVVLFEAGVAASHDLGFDRALASITIDAAKILGIDDRVGSLTPGKDADIALYDGDPFEYTTHCVGVIVNGEVVPMEEN